MNGSKLFLTVVMGSVLMLSGCVVRTYKVTRDRIDQNLETGNRGYLMGSAPKEEPKERKTTRSTQVVEVELRPPIKFEKRSEPQAAIPQESVPVQAAEAPQQAVSGAVETPAVEETNLPTETLQKYTVQKNDTLQKISEKFFGTTKKWMKIYDANREVLKAPNRIYPGQIINIPVIAGQAAKMNEPSENLK